MPDYGRTLAFAALALLAGACSAGRYASTPSAPLAYVPSAMERESTPPPGMDKIQHVVIIIQENRSFDNLFEGYPGANTRSYGYDNHGNKIALQPVGLATSWDLRHDSTAFFTACNGTGGYPGSDCRMNGFDQEGWDCGAPSHPCPNSSPPYSYVPHNETAPYFAIAKQYVLADEMFASNFDVSSFVSHQYIIAAQASRSVNYPVGFWGCEGGVGDTIETLTPQRRLTGGNIPVCFDETTLADELDRAGLSWRFYTSPIYGDGGFWSGYQAIRHIYYGPDWHKVIHPQTKFFTDVKNGNLPTVSWITPTCANSDHAGCNSDTGPSWVASLVNAIGESPYWKSTAVFIFWDDYGGWYDHVAPKVVDYDGLGLRMPLLIVSPYAKRDHVSHVHYEHGSILRFIEDRFDLGRLAASDTRANSVVEDCFDFSRPPRKFSTIPSAHDSSYFMHQPLDLRPPDTE